MMRTVLICDDDQGNVDRWKDRLTMLASVRDGFQLVGKADFKSEVDVLEQRRGRAREGKSSVVEQTIFDDAEILIVDFDLIALGGEQYLTGETVAYLARCYSECGVTLVLNQFGTNTFDLTLRGHPESFADLNIGSEQVANGGLWDGIVDGFHPWSWPVLPNLLASFRRRVAMLASGGLDEPIVEVLGIPPHVVSLLPRKAVEFVGGDVPLEQVTFRTYVTGAALRRKDILPDDEAIARVATSRIGKWCERLLLPEQDLIVDAPHLVLRYPSLLGADWTDHASWDRLTDLRQDRQWRGSSNAISPFQVASDWFYRPVWLGRGVGGLHDLPEVTDPWSIPDTGLVFCEDLSRFLPHVAGREFVADLESPNVRRFVADPDAEAVGHIRAELQKIEYRPAVRFSL
jgi:hypothetical protein